MDPILEMFERVLADVGPDEDGECADYIPELAGADPDRLGLAGVGPTGRIVSVGDDRHEFTIQSISKPFVLALALAERGRDAVLDAVGVEPSGEAFNAISLEPGTGRPANPMINAGAIATTSLIEGDRESRTGRIVDMLSQFAGRSLSIDEKVYRSESETGDRNRALAHLMRSHGIVQGDVQDTVESYFRQCSVLVTVRDLAIMAGTLAFGGINPVTGRRVVSALSARHVTSIMASCGMYDFSGEWLLRVGLPAKSGVSGGLLAVSPSQLGIAAFSPKLDAHGNSVRAAAAVQRVSEEFGLHAFELHESIAEPTIRIDHVEGGIVLRLSGELGFAGSQRVLNAVSEATTADVHVTVDARDVARLHPAAAEILRERVGRNPARMSFLD